MRPLPLLLLIPLVACSSSREGVLEDLHVDATDIDIELPDGATLYQLDDAASPELVFQAVGATGPQHGTWSQYNVAVVRPGEDLTDLSIEVQVQVDSVVTNYAQLDNHLKTADFFDTDNHPTASFVSTRVTQLEGDVYTVTGDMTLRGTTRELSFPSTIEVDGDGLLAAATIEFSRWDYGLIRASADEPEADGVEDRVVLDYRVRLVP